MTALAQLVDLVRLVDVGDQRTLAEQAHMRIGIDAFRAQALHLDPALVDFHDAIRRRALLFDCCLRPLLRLSGCGHSQTILPKWFRLSSDRAGCLCRACGRGLSHRQRHARRFSLALGRG